MTYQDKKIYFVVGAAVILVLIGAAAVWLLLKKPALEPSQELLPAEEQREESTYGTLPETKSLTNPLEKSPGLNPAERTNPFKDAYKNPFE